MSIQNIFYDGDTCTAQIRAPGTPDEIIALSQNGQTVIVEKKDLGQLTRMKHHFHIIASEKMKLVRSNAMWHVAA